MGLKVKVGAKKPKTGLKVKVGGKAKGGLKIKTGLKIGGKSKAKAKTGGKLKIKIGLGAKGKSTKKIAGSCPGAKLFNFKTIPVTKVTDGFCGLKHTCCESKDTQATIEKWNGYSKTMGNWAWSQAQISKWVNFMSTKLDYDKVNTLCTGAKKPETKKDDKKKPDTKKDDKKKTDTGKDTPKKDD